MNGQDLQDAFSGTSVSAWRYFDSTGSTNTEALRWAEEGAPDFSLVIADEQTSGRGRFERRWITLPGSSLAFSLILQPTSDELAKLPLFAPLCGIAVREAVNKALGLCPQIKWPNDVLLDGLKFCGILVESSWQGSLPGAVIMGIGINVNRGSVPPPELQGFPATCLETAAGRPVNRYTLLREVLLAIAEWRVQLGTPAFMQRWQEHLAFRGQRVRIENSEKPLIVGKIEGINASGQLLLTDDSGVNLTVTVGDVHLRPMNTDDPGGNNAG
ncbi:MAG TPA: biotin--[acetyl-CoA-carboxylase] ligase [Anaerolineaceae bacterium]|nr:biotin--[acetyl-CoA-carboxylase] ligase [Anaerolineaceae bacterium]